MRVDLQLQNVKIIVADISVIEMEASYDRIFSIEMFEDINEDDWITGLLDTSFLEDDFSVVNHWLVNGKHYAQTSEEWLKRMDKNLSSIKPIMESTYGKDSAVKWTVYWRTFFIAVAELFGYNDGEEWMVAHFLFKKK
nr:(s)-coclaurine n-methyltransferase [Quercus suber]